MSTPTPNQLSDLSDKWEGAEEWMPLAWHLCAEENGEDACTELIWEGGPIPEPWGDRWLKYEDDAKRMIELVRTLVPAQAPAVPEQEPFQSRVQPWMLACFGPVISSDKKERNHRFLEEALELVQANGCTQSEAHQLVNYVYGRPTGEPNQEVGGVMVTLAALCLASGLDMHAAGETELARIWTKVDVIRAKQAAKPQHSPLPEAPAQEPVATVAEVHMSRYTLEWTNGPLPEGTKLCASPQPEVCCGEYETCQRTCMPRGRWLGARDAGAVNQGLLEALKEAKTGLEWYQSNHPESVDGSDDEAMERIDAAIAAAQPKGAL